VQIKNFVLEMRTPLRTVNYLADNFSENVNESGSKFERVVLLFKS